MKRTLLVLGGMSQEDFLAEFCTSSLSQCINTELCTHDTQVAMVYWSSHLTRVRSYQSFMVYFTKDWLQAFLEANFPRESPSNTSSGFEPKKAPLILIFSTTCSPLLYLRRRMEMYRRKKYPLHWGLVLCSQKNQGRMSLRQMLQQDRHALLSSLSSILPPSCC